MPPPFSFFTDHIDYDSLEKIKKKMTRVNRLRRVIKSGFKKKKKINDLNTILIESLKVRRFIRGLACIFVRFCAQSRVQCCADGIPVYSRSIYTGIPYFFFFFFSDCIPKISNIPTISNIPETLKLIIQCCFTFHKVSSEHTKFPKKLGLNRLCCHLYCLHWNTIFTLSSLW